MSKRVFGWEDNPAVDHFRFRQSNKRAEEIVASGRGRFITLADGMVAVQLYPVHPVMAVVDPLERIAAGTMGDAWEIRPSGCRKLKIPPILVLQMRRGEDAS